MLRALLASAFLFGAAAPALAQGASDKPDEVPTVAPATVTASPETARNYRQSTTGDPNRRICRTQTATGSRLSGAKVCKTAREWEEQRAAAKMELDRYQRPPATNGN